MPSVWIHQVTNVTLRTCSSSPRSFLSTCGPLQVGWWSWFCFTHSRPQRSETFVEHFYSSRETHKLQYIQLQNSSSRHSLRTHDSLHNAEMLLLYMYLQLTEAFSLLEIQHRHFYFNASIFCHFKLQSGSKNRSFCLTTPRHLHLDWFPGSFHQQSL